LKIEILWKVLGMEKGVISLARMGCSLMALAQGVEK
jgi:hypothetical protein